MSYLCNSCEDNICPLISECCRLPAVDAKRHVPFYKLADFAAKKCAIASMLVNNGLESQNKTSAEELVIETVAQWTPFRGHLERIIFKVYTLMNEKGGWGISHAIRTNLDLTVQPDDEISCQVTGPEYYHDLGRPEVCSLARTWTDRCSSEHPECTQSEMPLLPSRIVNVGTCDLDVRLEDGTGRQASYLTLSYCWGRGQTEVTTSKTVGDFTHDRIPVEKLSKTVQDAITVTRNLGYNYLWVDALCIIQDIEIHKAIEISKMPEIYSHSVFTISAEESSDSAEGFLKPNGKLLLGNKCLASNVPFDHPNGLRYRIRLHEPAKVTSNGPIHKRAWTFQEHFLSRRILYFGSALRWQCLRGRINNSIPLPNFDTYKLGQMTFNSITFQQNPSNTQNTSWHRKWEMIVEVLTSRGISATYDRLPALSGIASVLNNRHGDVYLAGLWRRHLLIGLCWHNNLNTSKRGTGPTWSWASLSNPKLQLRHKLSDWELHDLRRYPMAKIIASETVLVSEQAKYGQVTGGTLLLEGALCRFCRDSFVAIFTFLTRMPKYQDRSVDQREWKFQFNFSVYIDEDDKSMSQLLDLTSKDPEDASSLPECWLLEIFRCLKENDPIKIAGLLLSNREEGVFERIGFYEMTLPFRFFPPNHLDWMDGFEQTMFKLV